MLRIILKALTMLLMFDVVMAGKYDFGYSECTYNTYKFQCLSDNVQLVQKERYGLVEFPDISSGVTCLKLKSNKIERFPKYLADFNTVISLDVSQNRIKEIPINLNEMSNIELIDLSKNGITHLSEITKFPPSLRGLILSGNELTSLPEISIPGLFVLDLSRNQFETVPWTFCVSKELIRVDFTKNPLKGDTAWYVDKANACKNRNGVKFCFYVDKPEINCECESIGPLIGFEPSFCLGSLERGAKFTCSKHSSPEYVDRKVYSFETSNVTLECNLLRASSNAARNQAFMFGIVLTGILYMFL